MNLKHYKLFVGCGYNEFPLLSFDTALRDAGIGDYNLIKVSSILPPHCEYTNRIDLEYGSLVYAAYSNIVINPYSYGSVSVAIALPAVSNDCGVIFEYASDNPKINTETIVKEMCKKAMFERKREFKEIINKTICLQNENNLYCSLIASVVMW